MASAGAERAAAADGCSAAAALPCASSLLAPGGSVLPYALLHGHRSSGASHCAEAGRRQLGDDMAVHVPALVSMAAAISCAGRLATYRSAMTPLGLGTVSGMAQLSMAAASLVLRALLHAVLDGDMQAMCTCTPAAARKPCWSAAPCTGLQGSLPAAAAAA